MVEMEGLRLHEPRRCVEPQPSTIIISTSTAYMTVSMEFLQKRIIIGPQCFGETCSARDLAEKRDPMERLWNNLEKR